MTPRADRFLPASTLSVRPESPVCRRPRPDGSIAIYDRADSAIRTREAYACVSAESFRVELPAGRCAVTIERGKEYVPVTRDMTITEGQTLEAEFRLRRLFDMAAMSWYSGDLHVHTPPTDLPAMQLADDLNVSFPITAWATDSREVPRNRRGGRVPEKGELVRIDDNHVYWNLNTEYEIFSLGGKRWTQGALLILGHQSPFKLTAPPVKPVAEEARRQGAIMDWDKHSWPWSAMLVPVAGVDTIELSNNHMWRLKPRWSVWEEKPAPWMNWTDDATGWAEYGFQTYYALLNSGFILRPSAGTANGVHPVPLGHSRVYVKTDGPFTYDRWIAGLRKGRSFVTNGPMLLMEIDGMLPGDRRTIPAGRTTQVTVAVEAFSIAPVARIELIVNGKVIHQAECPASESDGGLLRRASTSPLTSPAAVGSPLAALRHPYRTTSASPTPGRSIFDDPTRPLAPAKRQIDFFIDGIEAQIKRNAGKLSDGAAAEYDLALRAYQAGCGEPAEFPGAMRPVPSVFADWNAPQASWKRAGGIMTGIHPRQAAGDVVTARTRTATMALMAAMIFAASGLAMEDDRNGERSRRVLTDGWHIRQLETDKPDVAQLTREARAPARDGCPRECPRRFTTFCSCTGRFRTRDWARTPPTPPGWGRRIGPTPADLSARKRPRGRCSCALTGWIRLPPFISTGSTSAPSTTCIASMRWMCGRTSHRPAGTTFC